jgi:hypothetical protein
MSIQQTRAEQVYPAGTILSCPIERCGLGLYKVVEPASFEDLVVFDDVKLARLNDTVPVRDVWQVLACPFCGARLLKDGKIHTFQYGWIRMDVEDSFVPRELKEEKPMVSSEQRSEYGSFARLVGENSMEAWTLILLEDRRCMDCKAEIEDLDGAMVFRGRIPQVELEGHLCDVCLERREEVRCYRLSLTIR